MLVPRRSAWRKSGEGRGADRGSVVGPKSGGNPPVRAEPHHRPGRSDGGREEQGWPSPRGAPRLAVFRFGSRDRGRRRRDDRGDFCQPRRARLPRRRAAGHCPAAGPAGSRAGDRRRRLYGPGDPGAGRAPRRLAVAARRSRRAGVASPAPQQSAQFCRARHSNAPREGPPPAKRVGSSNWPAPIPRSATVLRAGRT